MLLCRHGCRCSGGSRCIPRRRNIVPTESAEGEAAKLVFVMMTIDVVNWSCCVVVAQVECKKAQPKELMMPQGVTARGTATVVRLSSTV